MNNDANHFIADILGKARIIFRRKKDLNIDAIRFSQTWTSGNHLYRRKDEAAEIIFENTLSGVRKIIVDDNGKILNFPGLAHRDVISAYSNDYASRTIRYPSCIKRIGDHYGLVWRIQPDGQYWEDDYGFGRTTDEEINLYARLNENGYFIERFRLYSIGDNILYGTDLEKKISKNLHMKRDPVKSMCKHIPGMFDKIMEYIEKMETGSVSYYIPGTIYQVKLYLLQEKSNFKWYIKIGMSKCGSKVETISFLKTLTLEDQRNYLKTEDAKKNAEEKLTDLYYTIKKK